jgi:hypothetical protein
MVVPQGIGCGRWWEVASEKRDKGKGIREKESSKNRQR